MNIVILGSSAEGVYIIEHIRAKDQESTITLFSFDGHYPNNRDRYASFIDQSIAPEYVFSQAKDFYEKNKVAVVLDQKITRINLKRKKIFTEDKQQKDYDVLIVSDTPENRYMDIKGTGKSGVFGYKKLKDIDQLANNLPLVETVAIQSDSFSGLQAAAAIAQREKEIIFISSQNDFLGRHFKDDVLSWLIDRFEEAGIRLMRNNSITEILGEKDAKAIRVKEGKVYSAEAILFGEMNEDFRLFSDSGLQMDTKIKVNQKYQTNIDSIYVVDQVCAEEGQDHWYAQEPVTPTPVLEAQAKVVVATIAGEEPEVVIPLLSWDFEIKGVTLTIIGDIGLDESKTIRRRFIQETGSYTGLYVEDNCVVGAILVNADDEKDRILRQINDREQLEPEIAQESEVNSEPGSEQGISPELIDN